jgi:hypothetical protein
LEGDIDTGFRARPLRESDRDLGVDSEGLMQPDLPAELRSLSPADSERDCRRDSEGGSRMGLQVDSQGEARSLVPIT